jgi:predicted methyltransferase
MWAPALGVEEDVATGGACAALVGATASRPGFGETAYRLSTLQGVLTGGRSEIEAEARNSAGSVTFSASAVPRPTSQAAISTCCSSRSCHRPSSGLPARKPKVPAVREFTSCLPHQEFGIMEIDSRSINTTVTYSTKERSLQRSPIRVTAAACAACAIAFGTIALAAEVTMPGASAAITAAVADSSRPDSDTARDADRKPEQTLVFAGIKAGDRVADYVADSGYFTRLFSSVVGSEGHVYAVEPTAFFKFQHFVKAVAELQGYAVTHPNLTVTTAAALEGLRFPEKLDLFWISQNYHDLHDEFMGPVDTTAFNKAVYSALKPGGYYVILDHSAAQGAPAYVTETLHRIESSTVRREVEAAGFKFDSDSSILANPADPRTARVFDQTIRGHTDQFILRFRKPI